MNKELHLGQIIQIFRREMNLKQNELASLINLSNSMISHIEKTGQINDKTLKLIAGALKTDVNTIKNFNRELNPNFKETIRKLELEIAVLKSENDLLKSQLKDKDKIISLLELSKKTN